MQCDQCSPNFKALAKLKAARSRDRMRANELPPDTQREELRALSKLASEELLRYDEELARLRYLVHHVENQKQELQRELTLLDSLHAPIRLLPPEILGKIFEYYVEAAGGNRFGYSHKAIVPAAVLAAVCKRWRTLAFSSASLWAKIDIGFGSPFTNKLSSLSTVVGRSITAGGSRAPLAVALYSEKDELFERLADDDIQMLELIAKESDRWSTFISDIDGDFAMREPLQQIKGHLNQLWCLDIRQHVWEAQGQTLPMFSDAPKLQTLHFDELHHMPRVDIPLSQIRTMSVRLWESVNFETELRFCKDVTNLTINLAEGFLAEPIDSRFVLQCKELTVDASDHSAPRISERNFLAGIQCPNLNIMTLLERNDSRSTKPFSLRELHPFLVASGQKLLTLHITALPLKDVDELIAAFGAMPLLENLRVTEGCPPCCRSCNETPDRVRFHRGRCPGRCLLDAGLLRTLTITRSDGFTPNSQVVLPRLIMLSFVPMRKQGDFEFTLLADMLRSRCFISEDEPVTKLQRVELAFPIMSTTSSDTDSLTWLRKAGVYLSVFDKDRRVI